MQGILGNYSGLGVLGQTLGAARAIPNQCYQADACQPGISNYARSVLSQAEEAGRGDEAFSALVGECTRAYQPCIYLIANARTEAKALAEQNDQLFRQAAAILDTNSARINEIGNLMKKRDQAGAKKIAAQANTDAGIALAHAQTSADNVGKVADVVKEGRGDAQVVQYAQYTQQWAGQTANAAMSARQLADDGRAMAEKLVQLDEPPTCAPGQKLVSGRCVTPMPAPPRCTASQVLIAGKCVKKPVVPVPKGCPPGQTMVAGNCVAPMVAPAEKKSNALLYAGIAAAALVAVVVAKKQGWIGGGSSSAHAG